MTISSGGQNINYNPQPSIFQTTTTGREELAKQGALGLGNVVILPDSVNIPFTQLDNRTLWNYKSDPGRPALAPAGSFRSAGPDIKEGGNWNDIFDELLSGLPKEVQDKINEAKDQDYIDLKDVLQMASKKLEIQKRVIDRMETSEAELREANYNNFAPQVFSNILSQGKDYIQSAKKALELLTPNDPDYLVSKELLDSFENALNQPEVRKGPKK